MVFMVVEYTVGIGDAQRCVYTLIVGNSGDDLIVTVKKPRGLTLNIKFCQDTEQSYMAHPK